MQALANISALETLQNETHAMMGYDGLAAFNAKFSEINKPRLEDRAEIDQHMARAETAEDKFFTEEAANKEDIQRSSTEIAELQYRIKVMESNTEGKRLEYGTDYRKAKEALRKLGISTSSDIPGFDDDPDDAIE